MYPILHGLEKRGYLKSSAFRSGRVRRRYTGDASWPQGFESGQAESSRIIRGVDRRQMISRNALRLSAAILLISTASAQQQTNTTPLTIQEAVERAQKFPSIEASEEQVNAAAAGIRLARTNYLPSRECSRPSQSRDAQQRIWVAFATNRYPEHSGPVLGTNDGTNVWGSAAGVLISWEPFDFGRRARLCNRRKPLKTRPVDSQANAVRCSNDHRSSFLDPAGEPTDGARRTSRRRSGASFGTVREGVGRCATPARRGFVPCRYRTGCRETQLHASGAISRRSQSSACRVYGNRHKELGRRTWPSSRASAG